MVEVARRLLLLAALAGCAARRQPEIEGLPEEVAAARPTVDILEGAAVSDDPTLRAIALEALVTQSRGDARVRWMVQGSYDQDADVQWAVAEVGLRLRSDPIVAGLLDELIGRTSADPYVRLRVVRALGAAVPASAVDGWRRQPAWRMGPLAVLASMAGDPEAPAALRSALASGEVRDDVVFLRALADLRDPELASALATGAGRFEEEIGVRFAWARGLLGDVEGARTWRAATRSKDAMEALDAVELLLPLTAADRAAFGRDAPPRHPSARALWTALTRTDGVTLAKLQRSADGAIRATSWSLVAREGADLARVEVLAGMVDASLADEDPAVVVAACRAVLAMGWKGHEARLRSLLTSDDPAVQVAAAGALGL